MVTILKIVLSNSEVDVFSVSVKVVTGMKDKR